MRNFMLAVGICTMVVQFAFAQTEQTRKAFTPITQSEVKATGERFTVPVTCKFLRINLSEVTSVLLTAPKEVHSATRQTSGLLFEMPMADGSYETFRVFEYDLLHPALSAKFPNIKTYTGQGVTDPSATIKLDLTEQGFHAMVRSPKGSVFIDPYNKNTTEEYICYYKHDLQRLQSFNCDQVSTSEEMERELKNNIGLRTNGTQLRTYDLALACTGEYAAFFGGTVVGAQGGMTTTMNRVNGIYEDELSIRMQFVANNNLLIYTNSATDPYTNGNGSTMLTENQNNCNTVIGNANYDIGHVVSTGGGGVAGLGVVCNSTNKGRGVTGSGSPTGDAFDVDYVAHEMGHQFGGNHTFNSVTSSCNGNRSTNAAYEPGSGITIQAYAGICGSDNLASNSIAYFHGYSLDEMIIFSTINGGNSCPTTTATGNIAPVVTSMAYNCSIPISTPFMLTGGATDGNGDPLTYSWEERDLGTAGAWNVQSTTAPQFRPFPPTTDPSRTFPKLSDIINNTTTVGELLPNQARTLKFRLTARDNRNGGGGIMHPDTNVTVTVVNGGGAFAVTSPNTAVSWAGGSSQTVAWNVSGTTANGINTANVKISLSTDGGNTFPTVLLASTANDGSESVTLPNISTTTARIKVEAVGNIFFDMSNTNFTITLSAGLTTITTSSIATLNYCAGAALNVSFTTNAAANAGNVFTVQLSSPGGSFPVSPTTLGTITSTTASPIACIIPSGTVTGVYRIRVVSSNPAVTGSDNGSNINISAQVAAAGAITGTTITCQGAAPFYSVGTIANATSYNWSVPPGANIISGAGTSTVQIAFGAGSSGIVSVYGSNANCTGTSSSTSVTVNPTPALFNVTGGGAYCAGGTGVAVGVSSSQSGVGYQLIRNGSSVGLPLINGTGSAISFGLQTAAGTYTVNAAYPTGCNIDMTGSVVISINSLPTVTANNVSGCAGTSIALSGTPIGGTWSVTNPYTGSSTTYTHTYTDGNGCTNTSSAATITINPNPTPSISGPSSFCTGSSIVLDAGAGYSSYSWMPGGNTQTITVTVGSVYQVTVTNGNGCSGTSALKTVTENPTPNPFITGNTQFCSGGFTVLNAGAGFSGYSWSNGATTQTINASVSGSYAVTVTNSFGCSGTSLAIPVDSYPPVIPFITGNTTFCSGSSTVLDAGAGNSGYSWSTGATTQSISVNTAGTFIVTITDANGCTGSTSAITTVNPLPSAITSPSGTVTTCNLSQVLTANSGMASYQWRLNGSNITGATSVSYNATVSGNYTVVVTNLFCSATSSVIALTLGTGAPIITTAANPICAGTNTTLTAPAGASTYQWYRNGAVLTGSNSQTYLASSNGSYYCLVSGACSGNSNTIVLTVINNPNPAISNTTPLTFCNGGSVLLTSNTFSGATFQWQKNSIDIAGATQQTYSATTTGSYRVRQTANGCSKYPSAVTVNSSGTSVNSSISANGPVSFCPGGSVILSVNNAIPGYNYQWKNSGGNISGATNTSYTATTAGSFTCTITASCGTSTSNTITTTTGGITATISPSGTVTICPSAAALLSANSGTGYTYQWRLNGSDINNATSSTYSANASGNYTVFINSPCGSATSPATTVNISSVTASVTPAGTTTICAGTNITYSASTGFNYNYQWYRNGVALIGATVSSYVASSNGSYHVIITQGGACSATSNVAVLSVTNNPTPTVTPAGPVTMCTGQTTTLTTNAFSGVIYQWQKNSVDIAGATLQTYGATTAGNYRVKQTANGCFKYTPAVSITVNCRLAGNASIESDSNADYIKFSPNPFNQSTKITISDKVDLKGAYVEIYNILGRKVKTIPVAETTFLLSKDNLPTGVYTIGLYGKEYQITKRFVIQ